MSFSVADRQGDFEWATRPLGLFAKHGHLFDPRFHRMLAELAPLLQGGPRTGRARRRRAPDVSRERSCEQRGYSEYFVERMIVPQASADLVG